MTQEINTTPPPALEGGSPTPRDAPSDELVEAVARDLVRAAGAHLSASDLHWPATVAHYRAMVAEYGETYTDARSLIHDAMRNARVAILAYQKATGGDTRGEANPTLAGMRSEIERLRGEVIEECAQVAKDAAGQFLRGDGFVLMGPAGLAGTMVHAIRSLQTQERTNG